MFRYPFSFRGRIRRLEYNLSWLLYLALVVPLQLLAPGEQAEATAGGALFGLLAIVVVPPAMWFLVAQGAKRCHDRNGTGFFQVIPYYLFWLWLAPGQRGPNDYGPDPKAPAELPGPELPSAVVAPASGDARR